ncbi:MAG: glycosyltransferase family 2 protein [Acidimicrobiia bacterium]
MIPAFGISVVIPLYNGARYIGDTLDSLSAQSEPVAEVLVIDDGSSDDGAQMAEAHAIAPKVIRQANRGVAYCRNLGALLASRSHVAFLDQDDLWAPERHARLLRFLRSSPEVEVVVTTCAGFSLVSDNEALRATGERLHLGSPVVSSVVEALNGCHRPDAGDVPLISRRLTLRELLAGPPSVTASLVVSRQRFVSAGGCAPFARSFDDYIALLDMTIGGDVVLLDEPSLLYRIHPASTTMSTDWSRPLLAGITAVRHGGNIVPAGNARNPDVVPRLLDDRQFFASHIRSLACQGMTGFLDALAFTRLLGTTRRERARAYALCTKAWLRSIVPRSSSN